ncbi:MAG: sigma-70 family RNA polymerase sigma factor [Cytophagaceae bacterium]|nr:sigma-70 family RNA polymerase sigma factor [Cytophagaceae bacterium]MDW8457270.1 sigma-70 family RNA polymerase sigma factor [Cytophagaceae bacterium]
MSDEEVIARIKKGDERALDYLYKKNYKMMINMIIKNNGTEDEAKDIYQESLIVLWQKVISDDFVLSSKLSTYLYSICQNLWRKELDRKSKHTGEDEINKSEINDLDKTERINIINKCINELGETCKAILTYYYFDNLSMSDIAEKMGFANSDTAKTKKYKCKQELDKKIRTLYKASDFLD